MSILLDTINKDDIHKYPISTHIIYFMLIKRGINPTSQDKTFSPYTYLQI